MQYEAKLVHEAPELQCVLHRSFLPNSSPLRFPPFFLLHESFWELLVLTHYPGTLLQCAKSAESREERLHNLTFKPLRFSVLLPLHEFFLVFLPTLWGRWDTWRKTFAPVFWGETFVMQKAQGSS